MGLGKRRPARLDAGQLRALDRLCDAHPSFAPGFPALVASRGRTLTTAPAHCIHRPRLAGAGCGANKNVLRSSCPAPQCPSTTHYLPGAIASRRAIHLPAKAGRLLARFCTGADRTTFYHSGLAARRCLGRKRGESGGCRWVCGAIGDSQLDATDAAARWSIHITWRGTEPTSVWLTCRLGVVRSVSFRSCVCERGAAFGCAGGAIGDVGGGSDWSNHAWIDGGRGRRVGAPTG
jgi:hypothetical protein